MNRSRGNCQAVGLALGLGGLAGDTEINRLGRSRVAARGRDFPWTSRQSTSHDRLRSKRSYARSGLGTDISLERRCLGRTRKMRKVLTRCRPLADYSGWTNVTLVPPVGAGAFLRLAIPRRKERRYSALVLG